MWFGNLRDVPLATLHYNDGTNKPHETHTYRQMRARRGDVGTPLPYEIFAKQCEPNHLDILS